MEGNGSLSVNSFTADCTIVPLRCASVKKNTVTANPLFVMNGALLSPNLISQTLTVSTRSSYESTATISSLMKVSHTVQAVAISLNIQGELEMQSGTQLILSGTLYGNGTLNTLFRLTNSFNLTGTGQINADNFYVNGSVNASSALVIMTGVLMSSSITTTGNFSVSSTRTEVMGSLNLVGFWQFNTLETTINGSFSTTGQFTVGIGLFSVVGTLNSNYTWVTGNYNLSLPAYLFTNDSFSMSGSLISSNGNISMIGNFTSNTITVNYLLLFFINSQMTLNGSLYFSNIGMSSVGYISFPGLIFAIPFSSNGFLSSGTSYLSVNKTLLTGFASVTNLTIITYGVFFHTSQLSLTTGSFSVQADGKFDLYHTLNLKNHILFTILNFTLPANLTLISSNFFDSSLFNFDSLYMDGNLTISDGR